MFDTSPSRALSVLAEDAELINRESLQGPDQDSEYREELLL